jgi:hypothetical protein
VLIIKELLDREQEIVGWRRADRNGKGNLSLGMLTQYLSSTLHEELSELSCDFRKRSRSADRRRQGKENESFTSVIRKLDKHTLNV